jgi:hypothetical protein
MFYTPLVTPFASALIGPVLRTSRTADNLADIQTWYWRE